MKVLSVSSLKVISSLSLSTISISSNHCPPAQPSSSLLLSPHPIGTNLLNSQTVAIKFVSSFPSFPPPLTFLCIPLFFFFFVGGLSASRRNGKTRSSSNSSSFFSLSLLWFRFYCFTIYYYIVTDLPPLPLPLPGTKKE